MTLRRGFTWFLVIVALLLLAGAAYLALADLGRHKGRIENLVSDLTGRQFAINGELRLELFPSISLVAEDIRLANADWASKEPMVTAGRLAGDVVVWSLFSGPVDIRSFELRDATLLLERGSGNRANWQFKPPAAKGDGESDPPATPLPLVIEGARLRDVRLVYRVPGKRDRVVRLDRMSIAQGKGGLLALEGRGQLNEFPVTIDGEAGPLAALLKGRDVRIDTRAAVGRLALDLRGDIGRLHPLDGANLKITATGEELEAMLGRLELPVIASGALRIDATLRDQGKLTNFDLKANAGDLAATAHGTLTGLQLRGADIGFDASAADAARLAGVFGIEGVPAAPLAIAGRIKPQRRELRFENVHARLAGVAARLDGRLRRGRDAGAELRFELGVEDFSALRADLPAVKLAASGNFTASPEKFEITGLAADLDENVFTGSLSATRGDPRHLEADLASPRIDLTKYFPARDAAAVSGGTPEKSRKDGPQEKYLFSEDPLPLLELRGTEARLHVAIAELSLANKSLRDVAGTAEVDRTQVTLSARARGSLEGAIDGSVRIEPVDAHSANVTLRVVIEKVRAGLDMKEMQQHEVPPLDVVIELATSGGSARQLASNANGHIVLTQGSGKTRSEFLDAFGGDVLAQLRVKLNPFRSQDPFTHLDCSVLRADIVAGQVSVDPVLLQTAKVTALAKGRIDLHTENLTLDFDTRPRKGIGVSPGMFTNPFIRVEGTLRNPRLAVGAKGVGSGAVAAATGGLSVIAAGVVDRLKGEADMCRKAMERATIAP